MNPNRPDPRRGEVWLANMDPTVGALGLNETAGLTAPAPVV